MGVGVRSVCQIKQIQKQPPHYCLLADQSCWDIHSARFNIFETIALFTYTIVQESAGYVGLLNIKNKSIQLANVLQL
jgi:hypothetical protein